MDSTARQFSWILLLALAGLCLLLGPPLRAQGTYAYSTFLGGTNWEWGGAITTTPSGNVYIAVITYSEDFLQLREPPAEPPWYNPTPSHWLTVVGLDPSGRLLYSTRTIGTYFGRFIRIGDIAATADGTVTVVATHYADDLSFAVFVQLTPAGDVYNASSLGIGRSLRSEARGVAMDSAGGTYITGNSYDDDGFRVFVAKLGGYFTRLDTGGDYDKIVVDSTGHAVVAGSIGGGGSSTDVLLTWLDGSGSVVRSFRFGGRGEDVPVAMTLAADGGVVVTGTTTSPDFPVLNPVQPALNGGADLFLTRVSPSGETLASTYLGGGSPGDLPRDLATGPDGSLYLLSALETYYPPDPAWRSDSPLLSDDLDCRSALIARLDPEDFTLLDTACLANAIGLSLAVDPAGWISVTGEAWEGFKLVNPLQGFTIGGDAFATRMQLNRPPDCSGATIRPATVWPPNDKPVPLSILGVTDTDGNPITLTVTAIRQDEPRTGQSFDASGIGTAQPSVRAQRSGGGDGRVYRISFEARDDQGAVCTGEVRACVPHDASGRTCGDGGALVDSTGR